MTPDQYEAQVLKGLVKIFEEPQERAAHNKRISLLIGIVSLVLCFVIGYLVSEEIVSPVEGSILGMLSGFGLCFSFYYRQASKQIPLYTKYLICKTDDIKTRIVELNEKK